MTSEKLPEIKEQEIIIGQQMQAKESVLTVINDSPYDANVFVLNGTIGPLSLGYIKKGHRLALPTLIATALDVFVLFEFDSHLFAEWFSPFVMKIYYHKSKNWVQPGTELKISEM